MMRTVRWLIVVGLLLPGCTWRPGSYPTLEAAVEAAVRESTFQGPLVTAPELRLSQLLPGRAIALVTYTYAAQTTNVKYTALMIFKWSELGWSPESSGGSGQSIAQPDPPVDFHATCNSDGNGTRLAVAHGLVADPAIDHVAVTFTDGSRREVPVEHRAYLAAQPGAECVTKIEALSGGVVLHERIFSTSGGQPRIPEQ